MFYVLFLRRLCMWALCDLIEGMSTWFQVIPPGMEFNHIIPHEGDIDAETEVNEDGKSPDPPIWSEVWSIYNTLI